MQSTKICQAHSTILMLTKSGTMTDLGSCRCNFWKPSLKKNKNICWFEIEIVRNNESFITWYRHHSLINGTGSVFHPKSQDYYSFQVQSQSRNRTNTRISLALLPNMSSSNSIKICFTTATERPKTIQQEYSITVKESMSPSYLP